MYLLGDLNDRSTGKDEIEEALGDLKVGKAPGWMELHLNI